MELKGHDSFVPMSWGRRFISNSRKHLRDSRKRKTHQKKKSDLSDSLWFPYFACLDLKYATLPWSRLPSAPYRASFLPSIHLLRRSHWQPNMTSRLICPGTLFLEVHLLIVLSQLMMALTLWRLDPSHHQQCLHTRSNQDSSGHLWTRPRVMMG